jgi:hypothetical protein
MAFHGPSGADVVAASAYPTFARNADISERRAMLVLPTVIEAVFISMEKVIDSDILRMDSCKSFNGIVPSMLPSSRSIDR